MNIFNLLFSLIKEFLLGDASKAEKLLNWKRKVTFLELVKEMVESDIKLMKSNPIA